MQSLQIHIKPTEDTLYKRLIQHSLGWVDYYPEIRARWLVEETLKKIASIERLQEQHEAEDNKELLDLLKRLMPEKLKHFWKEKDL